MRKLELNREPLAELGHAELAGIAAGVITHGCTIYPTLAEIDTCVRIDRTPIHSVDDVCTT